MNYNDRMNKINDNKAQKHAYIEFPEVDKDWFLDWFAEYRDISFFGVKGNRYFFKDWEYFAVVTLDSIENGEYKFTEEWVDDINELLTLLKGGK